MLDHQHIVRRLNARRFRQPSRIPGLVFFLALAAWAVYSWATPPEVHLVPHPYVMGAPGTTATDWREGTFADNAPGLDIDIHRIGRRR